MSHEAETAFGVHELIARRWSPRAFDARPLDPGQLGSLLEAARWAPSCFNDQPWSFLAASRRDDPEGFERLASCLVEGNSWAKAAPVLVLSVARLNFARNDRPNRHALHDVGLAAENLVLQAEALGLCTHQMAGFDAARAREVLAIPAGHEPVAMIAVGHPGDAATLPEPLRERESAPRERRALSSFAFGARFGEPLDLGAGPG